MSGFSDRDLIEAIYDVRDRVTRIEEKLNRTEGLSEKIDEADKNATKALEVANQAKEQLDKFASTTKWVIGIICGFVTIVFSLMLEKLFL